MLFRSNKVLCTNFHRSEEFTFQSPNAEGIWDLVVYFLETEEDIAMQDYKALGRTIYEIIIKVG